jgi:hypothetical protein
MALARAAAPPWTQRLFEAIPLRPVWVGVLLAAALISLFLLQEFVLGRHTLFLDPDDTLDTLRDVSVTVVHCLLISYLPTAYVYLVRASRDTVAQVRPILACDPQQFAQLAAQAGRYDPTGLRIAAVLGVSGGLLAPYLGQGEDFYTWSALNAETLWHRVMAPVLGYWLARLMFAVLSESLRFSALAGRLVPLDLFDLQPLTPFTRQGLTHALVVVGFSSIQSLFLIESGYGLTLSIGWILTAGVATTGLLVPVNGVRKRIRDTKAARLGRWREDLRRAQASLDARDGSEELARVANLLALRQHLSEIREWPFDASTTRPVPADPPGLLVRRRTRGAPDRRCPRLTEPAIDYRSCPGYCRSKVSRRRLIPFADAQPRPRRRRAP